MGSRVLSGKLSAFSDPLAWLSEAEVAAVVAAGGDLGVCNSAIAALDSGSSVVVEFGGVQREVVALASVVGAVKYVGRGDLAAADKGTADFIKDAAFHTLDLTAIIPAGATAVFISLSLLTTGTVGEFALRPAGFTGAYGELWTFTVFAGGGLFTPQILELPASRLLEYRAAAITWATIDLIVRGWLIPVA